MNATLPTGRGLAGLMRRPLGQKGAKNETAHAMTGKVEIAGPSRYLANRLALKRVNELHEHPGTFNNRVTPVVSEQIGGNATSPLQSAD
jgi:hypothetical protein